MYETLLSCMPMQLSIGGASLLEDFSIVALPKHAEPGLSWPDIVLEVAGHWDHVKVAGPGHAEALRHLNAMLMPPW